MVEVIGSLDNLKRGVKMIKVFIPKNKCRVKTKVRGFWRNDKGKTYYDYLKVKHFTRCNFSILAQEYNQEAIFYIKDNKGYCFNNKTKLTEVLPYRLELLRGKAELKQSIKEALKHYQGVTVYNKENGLYLLEIFYT